MTIFRRLLRLLPAVLLIAVCFTRYGHAQGGIVNSGSSAPEIDPSMVGGGIALLGGVALLIRSNRRR